MPDNIETESLARVLADHEMVSRGALPFGDTSWWHVNKDRWLTAARAIIVSDWLDAHDARVRAAERERLSHA